MKRKKQGHHANHERWLVSYADLLTLLFAFFVVMYAVGHSDTPQVHQLTQAIMAAFSELGMFTPSQMQSDLRPMMSVGYAARQDRQDQTALASLRERMQTAMAPQIHNHQVSMDLTHQGLVIRVQELGFFDSGSDQMRPEAAPILDEIATALRPLPNEIRVEGHTDNIPIHTPRFASNWQLSAARAAAIAQIMVSQYQIDPSRISAAGYAEYRPITGNTTAEGRQQNRRVDIVVVSQTKTPEGPPDAPQVPDVPGSQPEGDDVSQASGAAPAPADSAAAPTATQSGGTAAPVGRGDTAPAANGRGATAPGGAGRGETTPGAKPAAPVSDPPAVKPPPGGGRR